MDEKITGFRFAGNVTPRECSEAMKKLFVHHFISGGVTYSQFLFPYVDSLLLSEDSPPHFFGSHALLWQITPEEIMQSACEVLENVEDLCPQAQEIPLNAPVVAEFLADTSVVNEGVGVGCYASLLSGLIRSWKLREYSRGFCSLAEHIDRMKNHSTKGFSGGRLIICADSIDEDVLAGLYTSKTGGIAEFIYY